MSPVVIPPTLWNYAVCGQHPGAVAAGATVTLKCECGLSSYRYLIVQFPITNNANFCELVVYVRSKFLQIRCDDKSNKEIELGSIIRSYYQAEFNWFVAFGPAHLGVSKWDSVKVLG